MPGKKVKELRDQSDKELLRIRSDAQTRIMNIRFKSKIERPTNIMEIRDLRRQIGRINTILREREMQNAK